MSSHNGDWSDLFPEILSTIAERFETRDDYRHFRIVCKNWRSSITSIPSHIPFLSPNFPRVIFQYDHPVSISDANVRKIVVNSTFLIRPLQNPNSNARPKPWLLNLEEPIPGTLVTRKPLKRDTIVTPENLRSVDWSKFSVREISRAYTLRGGVFPRQSKVIVFDNPSNANDCYIFVLSGRGAFMYKSLRDDLDNGSFSHSRVSCFDDIVNYKGAIWAIDRKGRTYVVSYEGVPKHFTINLYSKDYVATGHVGDTRKRLAESSEGLYLVHRCVDRRVAIQFHVYKLDEVARKWREVNSLGGRILFVTSDCCFFGSAEDFPGLRGNCVVFPKKHFPTYSGVIHPDEQFFNGADKMLKIGVFRLNDGESGIISNYCGRGLISNHSDFAEIFWPPPSWLFPDTCTSDRVDGEDGKEECSAEENSLIMNGWEQYDDGVDVPWSDIPSKILTDIGKCLQTPVDICRFRAVCKKWRASLPPPRNSNLLSSFLPHRLATRLIDFAKNEMYRCLLEWDKSLLLVASTTYLVRPSTNSIRPSKSWLITVEEVNPGRLFLRLPLRRFAIKNLPADFPKVWDLSKFHVSEISRDYNFRFADSTRDLFPSRYPWSFCNSHRVVLPPSSACVPSITDATILVWYEFGDIVSFSLRDESWSPLRCSGVSKFDDVINFKGKSYAIDRKGRVYVISCNPSRISRVVSQAVASGVDMQKRLVGSGTDLYLLVRINADRKISFEVYKLNQERNKWDQVNSLDDQILFVTNSFCFLKSARDFPGWKGNCVVFPENTLPTHTRGTHPDPSFFKRIIEELRIGVYYLGDDDGAKLIQSYPGYSDLFWPPPPWLKLGDCTPRKDICPDSLVNTHGPKSRVTLPVQHSNARALAGDSVYVTSELVPVLQKIWDKHGNITEQTTVKNPETVARAFESLAAAVLILKTTPWRSLKESQAGFLRATLSDLRQKRFRVKWLSPLVLKALKCQKILHCVAELKDIKTGIENSKRELHEKERVADGELDFAMKARIQDTIRRLLEREGTTDAVIKLVEEKMEGLGPIDLESCIGEGLC